MLMLYLQAILGFQMRKLLSKLFFAAYLDSQKNVLIFKFNPAGNHVEDGRKKNLLLDPFFLILILNTTDY